MIIIIGIILIISGFSLNKWYGYNKGQSDPLYWKPIHENKLFNLLINIATLVFIIGGIGLIAYQVVWSSDSSETSNNTMSIVSGVLFAAIILISGFLKVLFSLVSESFGNRVPFIYLFLGISLGFGDLIDLEISFWPTYIAGSITALIIAIISGTISRSQQSIIPMSASAFLIGSLIGLVIGLFI
jgi:hypothetical protein